MITQSLNILINEINNYLSSLTDLDLVAVLGNFADQGQEEELSEKIVLTLVRLEEESTLKNLPNTKVVGSHSMKSNPVIHLNLFVLFVCNYANYDKSLTGLSHIIKFFQSKYHFNIQNSDLSGLAEFTNDFKLWLNIHTPSFEESNHLWSMLGGKQYPSVMYKVKMITEERTSITSSAPLITEIENKLNRL